MTSTITAGITTLTGDPDAIRATGRNWRTAAMACAAAAAQVDGVAVVDSFLGDESTTWERRLGPDTSELLGTLATARDIVGGALVNYADVLEDCQQELGRLSVHRADAGATLDRWRDTPTAAADAIDSAAQTVHDLDARVAAVLARHQAGVRACGAQIDRAAALSPSRVAGVRSGVSTAGSTGGTGRFRQSSNAVMAGFSLSHPAQLSAIGPFRATDNPQDVDDTDPVSTPWIDPSLQATYRERFYNACLGMKTGTRIPGDTTEMLCGVNADAIVKSRENILIGLRTYPNALTQEEVYGLDNAFADGWEFLTDIMIGGCKTGGSVGACIFDIATGPIPIFKGAKAVKAAAEVIDDGADVVKAGERAADAGRAGEVQKAPEDPAPTPKAADAARVDNPANASIDENKFKYFFGKVKSDPHNTPRSEQNEGAFERIGLYDNDQGRSVVQDNLIAAANTEGNVKRTFTTNYGTFEVRESLLQGPLGFTKLESTWQVTSDGPRLTTVVPKEPR